MTAALKFVKFVKRVFWGDGWFIVRLSIDWCTTSVFFVVLVYKSFINLRKPLETKNIDSPAF